MANTAWRAARARCPNYSCSNAWSVTCTVEEPRTKIIRKLKEPNATQDWFGRYCAMYYTKCPIYRLIEQIEQGT